jgi:hypothetical protein
MCCTYCTWHVHHSITQYPLMNDVHPSLLCFVHAWFRLGSKILYIRGNLSSLCQVFNLRMISSTNSGCLLFLSIQFSNSRIDLFRRASASGWEHQRTWLEVSLFILHLGHFEWLWNLDILSILPVPQKSVILLLSHCCKYFGIPFLLFFDAV